MRLSLVPKQPTQALRSMLYDPWQKELAALLARTKREICTKTKGKGVLALLQIVWL